MSTPTVKLSQGKHAVAPAPRFIQPAATARRLKNLAHQARTLNLKLVPHNSLVILSLRRHLGHIAGRSNLKNSDDSAANGRTPQCTNILLPSVTINSGPNFPDRSSI